MQNIVDYAIDLPVLTLEEEKELVREYVATGSERAAHKLVLHHMKIVIPMAFNLRRHRIDVNDLIQEGNLGLMNALKNYDPSSSARFGTFARSYVRSAMLDYRFARKAPVFRPGMDSAGRAAALVVSCHYSKYYK